MENPRNSKSVKSGTKNLLLCEACEVDGVQNPATSFCVDCQDYLCFDCSSHHCVPKPTKHHKVLLEHEMPRRKVATSLSEDCAKHKGETIKFYCKDHQALGCHTCIATVHRACVCVRAITDFTNGIEKGQLYSDIKKQLNEMEELFKSQKKRISEKDQLSRRCNTNALATLRKQRDDVNKQFDKLEQNIRKESTKMSTEDTSKMKHVDDSCTAKLDVLADIKSDLNLLEETKQQKQLFIATVKAALMMREMKSALLKIKADTQVRQFQLFPNTLSNSLAVRDDSLGQLEIRESENDMRADSKNSYEQVATSTLIEMQSTDVVATDYQRCLVVHYDSNFTKEGHLKLNTGPWDMTGTGKNTVAVTLPHERKISFLFIDGKIQEVGQISTPGNCRGIAEVGDKFVVTFSNPAGIKVLSGVGEVFKDIVMDSMYVQLKQPAYVAVDGNKNIFVTDPVMNIVARINQNGFVEDVFRSIKRPLRICFLNKNLLVSEGDSAIVHMLSPDFKMVDTEYFKNIVGDISLSHVGISFQGILKVKQEDIGTLHELGKLNVKYVNAGKDGTSDREYVSVFPASDKRCVLL